MKISELPELGALTGREFIPIELDGATYRVSVGLLGSTSEPSIDDVPANPHALDDEFNGSQLSANWLWIAQGNAVAAVADGSLSLTKANTGSGNSIAYIYKQPPATPWTLTAKILILGSDTTFTSQGLVVASSNGQIVTFNSGFGSTTRRIEVYRFNNPNSYNSAPFEQPVSGTVGEKGTPYYARIKNTGSSLLFSLSEDGITFSSNPLYTESISSFLGNVSRVGFNTASQNGDAAISVEWARFNFEAPT